MNFQTYRPQPLLLPDDSPVTRELYDKRSHLPGKPPLTEAGRHGFESLTIFNDVYIDKNHKLLRAIGPPLVNLTSHILPLKATVTFNNQRYELNHRLAKHDRVTFHTFALPEKLQGESDIAVEFELNNGLRTTLTARKNQIPDVFLQFTTLQKNNPVAWVIDWLHYCKLLGVQRVLLYDNDSDNARELEARLRTATAIPDVILIHWPFPYGPVQSFYNQFCQASQNNHAYQCFGESQWTGHFDVDEYPVTVGDNSLAQILDRAPFRCGLMRFDSYWVPDVENVLESCLDVRLPSVRDFNFREREPRGKAHKYIARNNRLKMANTHNGKVFLGYRRCAVDTNQVAFLHYKSLTDDWRGYEKRVKSEPLDEKIHIRDSRVAHAMKTIDELQR